MVTPHISAHNGAFADTVLLPGDPLRAKWIADTFLADAEEVTAVRNVLGYTGSTPDGRSISVMGTGMGVPSISIYASELVNEYGVKRLIRIGSCGSIQPDVKIRDVVIAAGACTDSGVNRQRFAGFDFAAIADFDLLSAAVTAARAIENVSVHVGNVMTSDLFYPAVDGSDEVPYAFATALGVLGVEMEAAGLYGVAAQYGAQALALCTVSDEILTGAALSSADRQASMSDMVTAALTLA